VKYKNTKTGAVIETASICIGADWEEVTPAEKKPTSKKAPAKKKDVKADE
jgi:hypothetical protein